MNKPFGARAQIRNFPFRDLEESFHDQDGIEIEVKDGCLSVGVDDGGKLEDAKGLAQLYLAAWSARQDIKTHAEFNQRWETSPQGSLDLSVQAIDTLRVTGRLQAQVTRHEADIQGKAFIISQQMHDSASFVNDSAMVQKAQRHPALRNALVYYSQEVVSDERPLYGIYKSLEAMIADLDPKEKEGRRKLAQMVGQSISYVDDVVQTTQVKRHHKTTATRKLTDDECRQRVKILIEAFASSLS